jgi:hypothetical protein
LVEGRVATKTIERKKNKREIGNKGMDGTIQ